MAIAVWLGVHAWLWTLLPPVPRWAVPGVKPDSLAFTADGRSLVTCDLASITFWDAATGRREHSWPRTGRRPGYDSARSLLVVSPTDHRAIAYDVRNGGREPPFLFDPNTGTATALPAWENFVPADDPCIGFLPDGRTAWQFDAVLKPRIDVILRLWALPDGPARTIPNVGRLYARPSFSADGRRGVLALHTPYSPAGKALILDLAAGRVAHPLAFDGRQVVGAVLSPDGRTVAVSLSPIYAGGAADYPQVELRDAESGGMIASPGTGFTVGWNPDGNLVVVSTRDVRLVRPRDGSEVAGWTTPVDPWVSDAVLSRDGRYLLQQFDHGLSDAIRWLLESPARPAVRPGRAYDRLPGDEHADGCRIRVGRCRCERSGRPGRGRHGPGHRRRPRPARVGPPAPQARWHRPRPDDRRSRHGSSPGRPGGGVYSGNGRSSQPVKRLDLCFKISD